MGKANGTLSVIESKLESMKNSIEHLPEEKRDRLERVVSVIREMCDDVEMIILFGSHARGDFRDDEDLLPNRKSGAPSDFDLLVICGRKETMDNTTLWADISRKCNGSSPEMPFRIIEHDIKYVKQRLKEIHFFFSDIVREGCLLYTSGKYQLHVAKTILPEIHMKVAQEHFDHWFEKAKSFYRYHKVAFNDKDYNVAAFLLHQTAESCYKALLLVFTNYSPHNHYLAYADRDIHKVIPDMQEIFQLRTEADEDLFKNFDYAYIGARYDPKFKISENDLKYLSSRVKILLEITEKLCRQEIEKLRTLAE
jgi:HEPN domain-containing protein/predicted nucleotidyltransferase